MTDAMSETEIEASLRRMKVPEHLIKRRLAELARRAPLPPLDEPIGLPLIAWPVRLMLPWSYLISDNERHGVIDEKLILTSAYRRAKGLVRDLALGKLGQVDLPAYPLAIEARVWVPDDTRAHDVCNLAKCVHDALEGIVYARDRWLHDIHWIRAGVDVDAPRAEVTITPLLTP